MSGEDQLNVVDSGIQRVSAQSPNVSGGPDVTAIDRINKELQKKGQEVDGFIEKAEDRLAAEINEIAGEIGCAAVKTARKMHATVVDVEHVKQAADHVLGDRRATINAWLMGIVGVIVGASLAFAVPVLLAPTPMRHSELILVLCGAGLLVALGLTGWTYPRRRGF